MAVKLFRTIILCLGVLSFGSCDVLQYIFGSVFPATLALAKAQTDLSKDIEAGSAEQFRVRVIEAGSNRYVVVEGTLPTDEKQFFFYDLDLKLKRSLTLPVPISPATNGNGVMVDGGQINAGGTLLDPATLVVGVPPVGTVIYNNGTVGNDGFVATGSNITGFSIQSGSVLNYSVNGTPHTPAPTLSTMSGLGIDAVLDDGDPAGNAIIVLSQSQSGDNNQDDAIRYFVMIQKAYFIGTVPDNLLDSAPHMAKLERDSLGFADGSIVAYDRGGSRYIRMDPTDASIQASLYSNRPQDTQFAYRISGGEFFGFNKKSRILTKYVAWW